MNIFSTDSRFYRILDKIADFLLLNLLWLICSLPIITLFPATAAMFGIVRSWLKKEEPSLVKLFFTIFKNNFKQGIIIEVIWSLLATVIVFNILISLQMNSTLKNIILPAVVIIGVLFLYTSIFIFPIMVNYESNWFGVIKNAFLFSISQPMTVILGVLTLVISSVAIFFIPILFFGFTSFIAYILYYLCNKSFQKVELIKNFSEGNPAS